MQRLERAADRHFSKTKRWAALTLAAVLTAGTVGSAWADVQTTETESEQTSAGETGKASESEPETESAPATTESAPASTESAPASAKSAETETAAVREETAAESPVSIETKGSADIQVVVRFDFRGLNPQTATYLSTAPDNPISHYSVTITDQSTGQKVYSSDTVKRDTGEVGVLSLKPITVKSDWDMGQPDPSTKAYKDVTKTYSVQVAVPHFKPLAEKTFTLTAYQAGWKTLPEAEKESGKDEISKEENGKTETGT